jgi:hypothetical protein
MIRYKWGEVERVTPAASWRVRSLAGGGTLSYNLTVLAYTEDVHSDHL